MPGEIEDVCFWVHPDDPNRTLAEWTRPGGGGDDPGNPPTDGSLTRSAGTHPASRAELDEHLARQTQRAQRGIEVIAVLVVELDDFQDVTDLYGEEVDDQVLQLVAERLAAVRGATAFHLYGEIFVVIAESLRSRFDALTVARRVQRRISQPFVVEGYEVALSASIGVRVSLDGARDPAELVLDATLALAEAKRRGRGESVLFSAELRHRLLRRRAENRAEPSDT